MQSLNNLKAQIEATETIKSITQALGDIAAIKLKATRRSVEQNIQFFHDINRVYRLIKAIAIQKKIYKPQKRIKEGQGVAVLLTSNQHFYGGIDKEVIRFFIDNTSNLNCDRIVIGQMGKTLLPTMAYNHPFQAIQFKKDVPNLEELNNLTNMVFQYSQIRVFHNKFVTVLSSIPTVSDISASDIDTKEVGDTILYIVEPDVDKMIEFFESQILFLLFEAIFLEVDIVRQAARMISMNSAEENANKIFQGQRKQILEAKKQILNLQILETYAGILNKGSRF